VASGAVFLKELQDIFAGGITLDAALTSSLWPWLWGRGGFLSENANLSELNLFAGSVEN